MARIVPRRLAHPSICRFASSAYCSSVTRGQREIFPRGEVVGSRNAHSESVESTYGRHLPKVSDRIINVTLVSPVDGNRHNLKAMWGEGLTLLDALKRGGVDTGCPCPVHERGVEVCMGNCAVLVATEYLEQCPPRTEEETEVIRLRLQTGVISPPAVDKHIRLSCVLPLGPQHEGMSVGLTEPVAGETP
ncbi:hypothetical protein MPTK1_1g02940 [Marchantia polymorpha subsp. ruderalis]|nr:hypothetical protein MARPO_0113s0043 [Marchantia polymorpha]BBM97089.1 hypothetical protein Mp_1g02940 [Marchantia polymorpha subsp. ruderalis]|eukprot:PTQ31313.1 hypothetical protein MARPO_0113s0043 [Marchantia polymorpha]